MDIRNYMHIVANNLLSQVEEHLDANALFYYGAITPNSIKQFDRVLNLFSTGNNGKDKKNNLAIILNTPGGSAEAVERIVKLIRSLFNEVYFVVPDFAMSAGTIFCMSGNRIYMHRAASLGPIDPQVWNGKDWVPALGYLAKYEELIEKSKNGSITKGEILLLLTQDLAMLNSFQQARELTTVLIKDWLAKYKFQNWITHQSNPDKLGQTVTYVEKQIRAEEIATSLSDHRDWKSHSRYLDLQCLRSVLRLEIDEFSEDHDLGMAIIDYNEFIRQYIQNNNFNNFIHSRFFF